MGRPRNSTPARAALIAERLATLYPDAVVELDFKNPWQLLVATILAAQSTDKVINTITPGLFAKYPNAKALAAAEYADVEPLVFKSGFYRNKAKAIVNMSRALVEKHRGKVPDTIDELVEIPGVGRKTANVILGSAMGKNEGVVVDTHVARLSQRLAMTAHDEPVEIEQDLMKILPRDTWSIFAHRLIWHGRRVCFAKKPDCEHCTLAPLCPSAFAEVKAKPEPRRLAAKPPTPKGTKK